MLLFRLLIFATLLTATSLRAASPAEQKILEAIKSPDLSVVHLWAPWCSNCQAEVKAGGWHNMDKGNQHVRFDCVSIWNDTHDAHTTLQNFDITDPPTVP